jgi:hypothetical protein
VKRKMEMDPLVEALKEKIGGMGFVFCFNLGNFKTGKSS